MSLPNLVIDGVYIPSASISHINAQTADFVRVFLKSVIGGFIDGAGNFDSYYFDLTGEDAKKLQELLEGINTFQHLSLTRDHWHRFTSTPVNTNTKQDLVQVNCINPLCKALFAADRQDKYFPIIKCPFCEREFTFYQGELL